MIAATFLGAFENAGLFQLPDQPKCRALGDADLVGNVAQSCIRVVGETNQHVGVIAEKGPVVGCLCHRKQARKFDREL